MKTFFFIALGMLFWANQCSNKSVSQQQQSPQMTQKADLPPMKTAEEMPEVGYEEFEGNRILKGELYTSKGAILGIGGVFISEDYESDASNKVKPALRPLVGKTLEVKGDVYVYYCGRYEQCLTQGYMKWLRNVEYIKVIGD